MSGRSARLRRYLRKARPAPRRQGDVDEVHDPDLRLAAGLPGDGRTAFGEPVWTQRDCAALGTFMRGFNEELLDSGELVETRGLSFPVHTRRVKLHRAPRGDRRPLCRNRGSARRLPGRGLRELRPGHRDRCRFASRPGPERSGPGPTPTSGPSTSTSRTSKADLTRVRWMDATQVADCSAH